MKCWHCRIEFHDHWDQIGIVNIAHNDLYFLRSSRCPSCEKFHFLMARQTGGRVNGTDIIFPSSRSRSLLSGSIPPKFANDYNEASKVIAISPKASAALSRRCLQNILRDCAKVKHADLYSEIQELLDRGNLPSHIAEAIDSVRNIGNFAAHPMKSKHSGEIVDVEPGEAEWSLEVLEQLFDFYFVQPAILAEKKAALNKKLQEIGKPPMK